MPCVRRLSAILGATVLFGGMLAFDGGNASAQESDGNYYLTLVARVCPTYTDIMANLARNNIQESLEDLGKDTVYVAGQPIDPDIEAANQPNCTPLDGWKFTLGDGDVGPSAATDFLSTLSGGQAPITVEPSTPLLDPFGEPTGRTIDAAVTVPITGDNLDLALRSALWVQGGTPTDPLLNSEFPGQFGFGALRCAIDNLNGDNAEMIAYPEGYHNVFCFYYAVSAPPTAGIITVRKEIPAGRSDSLDFPFSGNISFNPGGGFTIPVQNGAPGSTDFVRAGGRTWSFTEQPTDGWVLAAPPTCTSANGDSTSTVTGGQVTVDLAARDHVTCTYSDRPDVADLTVFKQTARGTGGPFSFTVTRPDGTTAPIGAATTTAVAEPVTAGVVPDLSPGQYTVTEALPPGQGSDWALTSVQCNGQSLPIIARRSVHVTITSPAEPMGCTFTNTLRRGSIVIDKTTVGATGTARFVIIPAAGPVQQRALPRLSATTTAQHTPARAVQIGGEAAGSLLLGRYTVVEIGPRDTHSGTWTLTSASCGPTSRSAHGRVTVLLTLARPDVTCSFTDKFTRTGSLNVHKIIKGPKAGRQGKVVIETVCDGVRQHPDLVVPAGSPAGFYYHVYRYFPAGTRCTVSETQDGHTATVPVTVTGRHQEVTIPAGREASATIIDFYGTPPPVPVTG